MAKVPFANKNSNPKDLYESRSLYDELYPLDTSQFDLWNSLPLYGKVDEQGTPVYPIESYLVYISQAGDKKQLAALNFVANAFRKMREHYKTIMRLDSEVGPTKFFSKTLEPKRAWESSIVGYGNYIQALYEDFYENVLLGLEYSNKIKNFKDFTALLFDYIKDNGKAFTRMAYGQSRNTTVLNTGLAIEIYSADYGDDSISFSFINDPNFPIYEELCRKYGFRIDRNIPWRIIANLNSDNMLPFIKERLPEGTSLTIKNIFKEFYFSYDIEVYFEEFIDQLKIFYSTFFEANQQYKKSVFNADKLCNNRPYKLVNRESPFSENLNLSLEEKLVLFYKFRLAELNLKASTKRQAFHLKNVTAIVRSIKDKKVALQKALEYIQYNLGTSAYREIPLSENNLTRINGGGIMSAQDQFDRRTGEDSRYLTDDLSSS